jgi:hydrogenase maturation protein HypF
MSGAAGLGLREAETQALKIDLQGVVQGVGFRPFVYRLAQQHGLVGWVLNHSGGVEVEVEGPGAGLQSFVRDLRDKAPPLARIVDLQVATVRPAGCRRFEIRESVTQQGRYQLVSPDIATCADCRGELFDPQNRRYRYPFTNCTNCGPRFTIIRDVPYDRPATTMAAFPMCAQCRAEYDDPLDRRFHAQPNACPLCGPHVWLEAPADGAGCLAEGDGAIRLAAQMLLEGRVLGIKGLGGFHLACDATDAAAVALLRERKGRAHRPLAVMMAGLEQVRRHCLVSPGEEALLTGPQCPIVLLPWRPDSTVAREVAPENLYLGVMLPYTPLHHILLADAKRPLVMTSGNLSEEPIVRENQEARRRLGPLADGLLLHNRDIYARYDDSVVLEASISGPEGDALPAGAEPSAPAFHVQFLRRSRGYAPFPVQLPFDAGQILATGADLKNTFCFARDGFAFLSQHIGDMENLETVEHFESAINLYRHLYGVEPALVAHDLHPDYFSSRYALSLCPIPHVPIQHHEAHVASCLADNAWPVDAGPVIGLAWDGTGYGHDGHIWGGEFLLGDYYGFRRAAHLEYLPMPGGEAAIRNPWRLAASYLYVLTGKMPELAAVEGELDIVRAQVDRGINAPLTSAAGRLFDAVAALTGGRQAVTYEAQAAVELEMLATQCAGAGCGRWEPYPFDVEEEGPMVIRLRALLEAIQADVAAGHEPREVAWRFHDTLAAAATAVCRRLAAGTGIETVALSGGCFQNRLLLALTVDRLRTAGFRPLLHRQVPCNDGGLSLGQVVLAHFCRGTA